MIVIISQWFNHLYGLTRPINISIITAFCCLSHQFNPSLFNLGYSEFLAFRIFLLTGLSSYSSNHSSRCSHDKSYRVHTFEEINPEPEGSRNVFYPFSFLFIFPSMSINSRRFLNWGINFLRCITYSTILSGLMSFSMNIRDIRSFFSNIKPSLPEEKLANNLVTIK